MRAGPGEGRKWAVGGEGGANDLPRLRARVSRGFITRPAETHTEAAQSPPVFSGSVFSQMKGNESTFAMSGRPGPHRVSPAVLRGRFSKQCNHAAATVQEEVQKKKKICIDVPKLLSIREDLQAEGILTRGEIFRCTANAETKEKEKSSLSGQQPLYSNHPPTPSQNFHLLNQFVGLKI